MTRTMRRGGRGGRQRTPIPQVTQGHFSSGPMDPPPAFKSGWKAIRLEIGIGSTAVTLTTDTLKQSLTTLGIAANSIRLLKLGAWVMPGAAANQNVPRVVMSVRDPISGGSLGTREDTGQLSRAAHVTYHFAETIRQHAIDLPATPADAVTFAKVDSSAAAGSFQVSIEYNI